MSENFSKLQTKSSKYFNSLKSQRNWQKIYEVSASTLRFDRAVDPREEPALASP